MKHRNYKGRELLPLSVGDAACAGDTDAVEQVLRYYESCKLCTRTVHDESGCPHACLDEYMKSCLENKLIRDSRCELITGSSGRNSLPFPCSSRLWALSCVLERGNVFAERAPP